MHGSLAISVHFENERRLTLENENSNEKQTRATPSLCQRILSALPLIIFVLLMGALTLVFWPEVAALGTEEGQAEFAAFIESLGFFGWLVALGVQLLQIFLAFIPGEPIEILLGVLFGPWLGTFTCLLGIFIGTTTIYFLVRKLGVRFVKRIVGDKDITKYKFLSDPTKIEITVFILFFIPGTPKDALTYIAPLAPISGWKYLLIATFARIPSIVTSTILGDSIKNGDYLLAVIVFAVTALVSVGGFIAGSLYVKKKNKGD